MIALCFVWVGFIVLGIVLVSFRLVFDTLELCWCLLLYGVCFYLLVILYLLGVGDYL